MQTNPYSNQITGVSCIALLYDTSGFKNPNTLNKDLRTINVPELDGHKPCVIELSDGTCFSAPFYPEPITDEECRQLINQDYGIKRCFQTSDYWAGAVKACGGTDKMPTMAQLEQLANDLYDDVSGDFNNNRNNNLAIEMGFISSAYEGFYVWSNYEISQHNAEARYFYHYYTTVPVSYRFDSDRQALCLAE